MIDIHSHILPGLDDGAGSLEEALSMADMAVSSGTTAMACTVHSNQIGRYENFESPELQQSYYRLREALQEEGIPLTLVRGMEIFASDDIVERIRDGELISLNRSGSYLVEFPFPASPFVIGDLLREMLQEGLQPVIAHPERYDCVQEDPNYLYEWVTMGAWAQLNKASVSGRFGRNVQRTAEILLEHRLVQCVASDAHRADIRTTNMQKLQRYLERNYSSEYSYRLLNTNPSRILMGQPVEGLQEASQVPYRRYF